MAARPAPGDLGLHRGLESIVIEMDDATIAGLRS
jgi:hypothetical protein